VAAAKVASAVLDSAAAKGSVVPAVAESVGPVGLAAPEASVASVAPVPAARRAAPLVALREDLETKEEA